jgi:SAM-dependent methyltransferase
MKLSEVFYTLPEIWDFCLEKIYKRGGYVNGFIDLLERLGIKKGSLILDAGCGSGFLTLDLIKKGYRVVGTDKSDEMIRQIKINAKKMSVSIEAYNVMWSDLSKKFDPIFDMVYCRGNSLVYAASWERNWIVPSRSYEEIRNAIRNFHHVLKDGGYLYIDITNQKEAPHESNIGTVETKHGPVQISWKIEHDIKNMIRIWTVTLKFLKSGKTKSYPSYSYFLHPEKLLEFLQGAGFRKTEKNVKVKGETNYNVFVSEK